MILRLRIQRDELGDFDSTDRVIFEAKLAEASDFCVLGDALVKAGLFARDCRDLQFPPRPDGFPWAFRFAFVEMVQRWGDLRALCLFSATVSGTPFNP